MQLVERPEFREARPQTVFLYFDFIHHWRHPIRESLGPLRDAITEALDQGDQEYAGWLAATLLGQSFWAGRPLGEIDALARSLVPEIRSQPVPRTICSGHSAVRPQYDGPQRRSLPRRRRKRLRRARDAACGPCRGRRGDPEFAVATQKLGLHYWSGDYAGALDGVADEALEHIAGMAGTAFMQIIYLTESLSRMQCRAEGSLDQEVGAAGTGLAPQVGGGRTGQLRGTLCPDPGSVGERARAARQGGTATSTGRSNSPRSTSCP